MRTAYFQKLSIISNGISLKVFKMEYNLARSEYLLEEQESAIIISERFHTLLSYGTVLGILDIFCTLLEIISCIVARFSKFAKLYLTNFSTNRSNFF